MTNGICKSLGLDLVNINVYAKFITIYLSVQKIGPFSLFQNLDKCHFAILWARYCQYQYVCKILSKYSKRFKSYEHFCKLIGDTQLHKRTGDTQLLQKLDLGLAATDSKCRFAVLQARSCQFQCVCKILSKYSKRFKSYEHFCKLIGDTQLHKLTGDTQLLQKLDLGLAATDSKCRFTVLQARSCQFQCVCKILSKYSKRFKSYGHFPQTDRGKTRVCWFQTLDAVFPNDLFSDY